MAQFPLVSAIVATHNRGYIVCEAIDSILQQTYPNIEIVVVDDGSTDDTQAKLKAYGDRLRVVRQLNGGPAAARNAGIKASRGSLISFLDSDDLWLPTFIEQQVKTLELAGKAVGGVFSDLELRASGQYLPSMLHLYPAFSRLLYGMNGEIAIFSQRTIYTCLLEEMPAKLQALTLRAEEAKKVGEFLDSWRSGEDWEFLLRFTRSNALAYVNAPLVVMRTMADSTLARYKTADAKNLMERFIKEKSLIHERDALKAVRRGIAHHAKELGWQYLDEGHRHKAFRAYLRGFIESGDVGLLIRSGAALLPRTARLAVKEFKNGRYGQ